jgi:hypothetical protein
MQYSLSLVCLLLVLRFFPYRCIKVVQENASRSIVLGLKLSSLRWDDYIHLRQRREARVQRVRHAHLRGHGIILEHQQTFEKRRDSGSLAFTMVS